MRCRVHDRSGKLVKRKRRMPVNGIAMKRLLIERAAKAQAPEAKPKPEAV